MIDSQSVIRKGSCRLQQLTQAVERSFRTTVTKNPIDCSRWLNELISRGAISFSGQSLSTDEFFTSKRSHFVFHRRLQTACVATRISNYDELEFVTVWYSQVPSYRKHSGDVGEKRSAKIKTTNELMNYFDLHWKQKMMRWTNRSNSELIHQSSSVSFCDVPAGRPFE